MAAYEQPLGGMRLKPDAIMKRQELAQRKKDEFEQLYQDWLRQLRDTATVRIINVDNATR
jgi:peptidyl-prolyl cis-trans isomerase SurA